MNKVIAVAVAFSLFIGALVAQDKPDTEKDKAAIKQAALDYAEGYYEGNAERMDRALHPLLVKRGLVPSSQPGSGFLVPMNAEMLVEATRSGRGKLAPEERNIAFEVLDLTENTASAKIFTARFHDFLHLVRANGQWRILNVLWRPPVGQASSDVDKEKELIKSALDGMQSAAAAKDAEQVQRIVHPEIARRMFMPALPGGKLIVQEGNSETIVEAVRSGRAAQQQGQSVPSVAVLGVDADIASAKLSVPGFTDYVHLAKQNGQWRVLNGLATRVGSSTPEKK